MAAGFATTGEATITGITADSRAVAPGFLFAALPGSRVDGRSYIADAVARGAAAVLAQDGLAWPPGVPMVPLVLADEPRRALAQIAARFHGSQPRQVAAVTGTNGKTSTVDFLRQLLGFAGWPAASIGTLGVIGPAGRIADSLTTPDPVALHALLARLAGEGVDALAMEASSHGLDQFRLDGVRLAAAAFTNLTRDHLDYHGDMAAYRAAKLRLFDALLPAGAMAVAHTALEAASLDALRSVAARRGLRLALAGEGGDLAALLTQAPRPDGQRLRVRLDGVERELHLPVAGKFQADNVLVAAALAVALEVPASAVLDAATRLAPVRGRMELAARLANGAAVYVDYAHTPDALSRLLAALRPHARGRLILVFGAGGDRDPGKRPLMGEAARTADVAIVTDDNPRSEDPATIRAAVLGGHGGAIDGGDRRAAIARALEMAHAGDVVAVAGKGHEQGQEIAGEILPFDDVSVVREIAG
jgi:UDP-N-acetylmuramoyl-L-alanyl-D-glutamate--2,6-diaminopimelate ligase